MLTKFLQIVIKIKVINILILAALAAAYCTYLGKAQYKELKKTLAEAKEVKKLEESNEKLRFQVSQLEIYRNVRPLGDLSKNLLAVIETSKFLLPSYQLSVKTRRHKKKKKEKELKDPASKRSSIHDINKLKKEGPYGTEILPLVGKIPLKQDLVLEMTKGLRFVKEISNKYPYELKFFHCGYLTRNCATSLIIYGD